MDLFSCAEAGNINGVKQLLENADVNVRNMEGRTPLWIAASVGRDSIVELLTQDKRCNVNLDDNKGWTPLMVATLCGYDIIVQVLIDSGRCDVDTVNEDGCTALYIATKSGNLKIAKILLEANTNLDLKDKKGNTVLHAAAVSRNPAITHLFIPLCSSAIENNDSHTPISLAVKYNRVENVRSFAANKEHSMQFLRRSRLLRKFAKKNNSDEVVKIIENVLQKYSTDVLVNKINKYKQILLGQGETIKQQSEELSEKRKSFEIMIEGNINYICQYDDVPLPITPVTTVSDY